MEFLGTLADPPFLNKKESATAADVVAMQGGNVHRERGKFSGNVLGECPTLPFLIHSCVTETSLTVIAMIVY